MAMLVARRVSGTDEGKYLDQRQLGRDRVTQYMKIINNSRNRMHHVAIATLDYKRDPMWGEVIPVPNIRAGSSKLVKLRAKKLQLIEFKIKWIADRVRYLHEQPHTTFGHWTYYTVAELTFDDLGFFMSVLRWEPVPD